MNLTSFEQIVRVLNAAKVRYLVVGGLAVNAHGCLRFTNDVDLVVRLNEVDIHAAFKALKKLGYNPIVPITAGQFADSQNRKRWLKAKQMTVLQMWSDKHRQTPVDIFIAEPFDFDSEYQMALIGKLSSKLQVRFVSLRTLIRLKVKARRAEDKIDIKNLKTILKQQNAK